ncbi:hypothetical protein SUGI_0170000 [Cryptomeria japonica]|nr:hypothetical protein SUGI_0170000 [Cryptomeria japonica]
MGGNGQAALAQHQVSGSNHERRHRPIHSHPRFLQWQTPPVEHDVRLLRVLLRSSYLHPLNKWWEVSYTIMPKMGYFEFLPFRRDNHNGKLDNQPKLVELADVKVGKEYELVVPTYAGWSFQS